MSEKDEKPTGTNTPDGKSSAKRGYDLKSGVKGQVRPALLTAVLLAVTIIAAAANFMATINGDGAADMGLPIFLGGVALLCWLGLTLLSVMKRDRAQSKIMFIIFGISFVCFFVLMLTGVGGGAQIELTAIILGALSLPYFAIYALFEAIGFSAGGIILIAAIIYAALVAVNVWNFIRLREPRGNSDPDGEKRGFTLRMFGDGGRRDEKENKSDKW